MSAPPSRHRTRTGHYWARRQRRPHTENCPLRGLPAWSREASAKPSKCWHTPTSLHMSARKCHRGKMLWGSQTQIQQRAHSVDPQTSSLKWTDSPKFRRRVNNCTLACSQGGLTIHSRESGLSEHPCPKGQRPRLLGSRVVRAGDQVLRWWRPCLRGQTA